MLPGTPRARIRWAVSESIVILGIFLFWIGVSIVMAIVLGLLAIPYQLHGGWIFRPLAELARLGDGLWVGVIPLTVVSASLYVLVRGGGLLLEQYGESIGDSDDGV